MGYFLKILLCLQANLGTPFARSFLLKQTLTVDFSLGYKKCPSNCTFSDFITHCLLLYMFF